MSEGWLVELIPAACYANCDASTAAPVLNVNDFICFNNLYAMGSSLANCDGSTIAHDGGTFPHAVLARSWNTARSTHRAPRAAL